MQGLEQDRAVNRNALAVLIGLWMLATPVAYPVPAAMAAHARGYTPNLAPPRL